MLIHLVKAVKECPFSMMNGRYKDVSEYSVLIDLLRGFCSPEKCVPSPDCLYSIKDEPGKILSITLQNLDWHAVQIWSTFGHLREKRVVRINVEEVHRLVEICRC